MKTKLDFALEMLGLGLPVFPITHTLPDGVCSCGDPTCTKPGKHPLSGSKGWKDATSDPDRVRKMWAKHPDANIGAYPGAKYVVIDLDCKTLPNGSVIEGLASLAKHMDVDTFELMAVTFTVETPSGGYHLYFKADQEYSSGVGLIPGVDSRAIGGYVLAPGSVIRDKQYVIINNSDPSPIAENVSRFLRKIRNRHADAHKNAFEFDLPAAIEYVRTFLKKRAPAIEGYGGNSHTYATIAQVKDRAISAEKCLEILMEPDGWNERCEPPWDASELAVVIENCYQYGKDQPGSKGGGVLDLFNDSQVQDISEILRDGIGNDNDSYALFRDNFHNGYDFSRQDRDYDMIAPGWIPAQGITCFLAQRSMGKTTIMLDICMRLSCDMDWEKIKLESGWTICWIVGEDPEGVIVRMRAWQKHHDREIDPKRFFVLDMAIDINKSSEVELFAKFVKEEFGNRKKVVFVLDTWQRMTQSAESQSNDKDMQLAVHNVEALAKSFRGPCLIANHPPKANANTVMGSSVIENSSQAIIQIVDGNGGLHKAQVIRIKGEGYGNYEYFKFLKVAYGGQDKFGYDKTSVVAIAQGGTGGRGEGLRVRDIAVLDVLTEMLIYQGDIFKDGKYVANEIPLSHANRLMTQIRQRADDKEPLFVRWHKWLADIGWGFSIANKDRKNYSQGKDFDSLMEIVKSATFERPLGGKEHTDKGIYFDKRATGRGSVIKLRALEVLEPINEEIQGPENNSLDTKLDVSDSVDF